MHLKLQYYMTHYFDPKERCMTFHLDYSRRSDLDDSVGYWYVEPTGRTTSRVFYSCECKLRGWVPPPVYSLLTKEALTKVCTPRRCHRRRHTPHKRRRPSRAHATVFLTHTPPSSHTLTRTHIHTLTNVRAPLSHTRARVRHSQALTVRTPHFRPTQATAWVERESVRAYRESGTNFLADARRQLVSGMREQLEYALQHGPTPHALSTCQLKPTRPGCPHVALLLCALSCALLCVSHRNIKLPEPPPFAKRLLDERLPAVLRRSAPAGEEAASPSASRLGQSRLGF